MRPPRAFTRLHYNANSPGKVQVPVPPGTVIETDAEFAAALQAADGHFRVVAEPAAEAPVAAEVAAEVDAGEEPAKPQRGKSRK